MASTSPHHGLDMPTRWSRHAHGMASTCPHDGLDAGVMAGACGRRGRGEGRGWGRGRADGNITESRDNRVAVFATG